jgi:mRNA interferase MazF
MEIAQYNIILVNLENTPGAEIQKTRPCVVISPHEMNRYLRTIVVAPMTTRSRSYPTRVPVRHAGKAGWIVVDQILTIDRKRIIKILGTLNRFEIDRLKEVIREAYLE